MKKMGAKTCNSMEDTFLRRHEIRLSMSSHHSNKTSSLLMVVNTAIVVSWGGEKKGKREEGIRMQSQSYLLADGHCRKVIPCIFTAFEVDVVVLEGRALFKAFSISRSQRAAGIKT